MATRLSFSQRHPFLFGLSLLAAAMILLFGLMAAVRFLLFNHDDRSALFSNKSLGLVYVQGIIQNSKPVTDFLRELEENDKVKGVLLRVESPGGGVSASQEIYRAVARCNKVKPVVVSMGAVAASGGYYVACPARAILANPGTITGSIGVKMELGNFMGLMDMLGLMHESIVSGKFKDAGSPFRELTAEERAYFQNVVADLFDQFINDVAEARKIPLEKIRQVADGRILTGRQAQVEGLIDGLGGLDDAENLLKKLCSIPDSEDLPFIEGPREEKDIWGNIFKGMTKATVESAYSLAGPRWQAQF